MVGPIITALAKFSPVAITVPPFVHICQGDVPPMTIRNPHAMILLRATRVLRASSKCRDRVHSDASTLHMIVLLYLPVSKWT